MNKINFRKCSSWEIINSFSVWSNSALHQATHTTVINCFNYFNYLQHAVSCFIPGINYIPNAVFKPLFKKV